MFDSSAVVCSAAGADKGSLRIPPHPPIADRALCAPIASHCRVPAVLLLALVPFLIRAAAITALASLVEPHRLDEDESELSLK